VNLTRRLGPATGVPWRPVAVLTASGVGLLMVSSLWVGSSLAGTAVTVGVPLLGCAAAYVLDEAASEAVGAVPTSLRARSVARLVVAAVIVGLGALALEAVAWRSGDGAKAGITVQLAGLALVAVAASAALRRRVAEPGEVVGGGLLAAVLALAIAHPLDRWVEVFPSEAGQRWAASVVVWGAIGAASLLGLWVATRDPLD
jgi:MYXO-CTERM domain-containing protein